MTTLFRPVEITSAEQAEALPEGTPATAEHDFVRERCINGWTGADGRKHYSHAAMIGWTALVPIEAEEEHRPAHWMDAYYPNAPKRMQTRLVTPWEDA